MRAFTVTNVNQAYANVMLELTTRGHAEESRNGPVVVYPEPVAVTYTRPAERVLFSPTRRANPFFHLFEAFWMLAGRRDAAFLNQYVRDFGERYAERSGNLHGAYGYRWRTHFSIDQIEWAVDLLLRDPASRRAVIQMYDPHSDSTIYGKEAPRDIPCNTTIYLRLFREGVISALDLTVCCRSNDAIWGAYGANAVHFSVLQEYLAWRLDAEIGSLHQLSNNLHVYNDTRHLYDPDEQGFDLYRSNVVEARSLFAGADPETFHAELFAWMEDPCAVRTYDSPVFNELLLPMALCHRNISERNWSMASHIADRHVKYSDWSKAAINWMLQRVQPPRKPAVAAE